MKFSYEPVERDPATMDAAKTIVSILVSRGFSYKKASGALEVAQALLEETVPTIL